MRLRKQWVVGIASAVCLVLLSGCSRQLRECERARDQARSDLARCNQNLEAKGAELDECKAALAAQCEKCPKSGNTPPPGPIIIITPNPNSEGTYATVNGIPCNPVSASGDTLNAKAFGALMQFDAMVIEEGVPVTRTIRKAKLTLSSGKVLEIIKTGDYPGVFTWKLGVSDPLAELAPVTPAQDHDLRSDICSVAPVIEVEYQKLGGGTATTTAQSVTTRAYNF